MLDFRVETFLTVCSCMNFTRAAELLHITQPAVSQHIRCLEEDYGAKLFTYQGKKLSLTPAGRLLQGSAATMKHDVLYLKEQIKALEQDQKNLRMGATLTIGAFALPQPIAAYLAEHPDTVLHMSVANTAELLRLLDDGAIDFALVEGFYTRGDYDSLVYSREPYIAVCGASYPLPPISHTVEDLLPERLILRESGSGTREVLENYLHTRNLSIADFSRYLEISDMNAIKTLTRMNCGVAFLYEISVREELRAGVLRKIPLEGFEITHDFTFLWRRNSIFTQSYQELFHALRSARAM